MLVIFAWFDKYIWRFKVGKAGTLTVALALGLDVVSRAETFKKVWDIVMVPETVNILQSGWFRLALVVVGMLLMFRATTHGKKVPVPATLDERMDSTEGRLNLMETRWTHSKVETVLPAQETRMSIHAACLQKIALLSVWMDDVATLIHEAEQSHVLLSEIVRRYPNSVFTKAPLSKEWRPRTGEDPTDEPTRLGLLWLADLKRHVTRVHDLGQAKSIDLTSGVETQRLCSFVDAADPPEVTGSECLLLLDKHKHELDSIRSVQAAIFADPTLQRATIS